MPLNLKLSKNDGEKICDPSIYRSIVGSSLYLTTTTPDLIFPTTLLSRFMSSPSDVHLGVAKRVLRYVKGTTSEWLDYLKVGNVKLIGYSDRDWAGSLDDMKSIQVFFNLGSRAIYSSSKKQQVVAQSTAEAKYNVAAANQAIWLRNLLSDLGFKQESAIILLCDKKLAIAIVENSV
ncbi:secreted RxLR effector protein 161-like [Gossypium arboreum]|uniref:secreted RxLR effector protein 161-like n=1 Tax=Gossypium arboreum TaxID=29729 RepID=UPI0008190710|nr:secreted RxLR effector protein 161-like [Gossypium arboreum]